MNRENFEYLMCISTKPFSVCNINCWHYHYKYALNQKRIHPSIQYVYKHFIICRHFEKSSINYIGQFPACWDEYLRAMVE